MCTRSTEKEKSRECVYPAITVSNDNKLDFLAYDKRKKEIT